MSCCYRRTCTRGSVGASLQWVLKLWVLKLWVLKLWVLKQGAVRTLASGRGTRARAAQAV
jgi:hypothetical protein